MQCIYCRRDSSDSVSREHVIPESLGNTTIILPPTIVCDQCNNYFSTKVEKPFMELTDIRHMRFTERLQSKKGKVPNIKGFIMPDIPVDIYFNPKDGVTHIDIPPADFERIKNSNTGNLIFKLPDLPSESRVVSRFIAKVAVGYMAIRILHDEEALKFLIADTQLDPIKNHARRGDTPEWPISIRRIYEADAKWRDKIDGQTYQRVHEADFLITPENEMYFVMAIFGVEYVINIGGNEIFGYQKWLEKNSGVSPLYSSKNSNAKGEMQKI